MRIEGGCVSAGDECVEGGDGGCVLSAKGRKQMHNASSKVAVVVEKMLLPLLDVPLRTHVGFEPVADQAELDLMEEVDRRNPGLMTDCGAFTRHLLNLFDRYRGGWGGSTGYGRVSTTDV